MKQFLFCCLFFIFLPVLIFGQSIFENPINGVNSNVSNPYTIGQIVDPNIMVTGIGRGTGIFGINSNNRYDARSWKSNMLDPNAYFEFTIMSNTDKKIDFISFVYTGQISINGPTLFAFRSSVDGFTSDIGIVSAMGSTVSLSATAFQGVTSPIAFRLYGWAANTGTGTFSINDFQFNGIVSCAVPQITTLQETSLSCSSTSFVLNWPASLHASNYFIDVATDFDFINNLVGYQNKGLGNVLTESVIGLTAGETYYVRLHSSNGCETSSYSNTIKVAPPETIYDGSWTNGVPDATKNVRFLNDFNVNGSLEACSCQIDDGVVVHVDSGGVLKLQNELDVLDDGVLTFENNASLVQVNNEAVNTGEIIYRRNSSPMKNFDFTNWSSPVEGQMLNVLSPNTLSDKYFSFSSNAWYVESGANKMLPAIGYAIRVPKSNILFPNGENWTGSSYVQKVEFKGKPNNGVIEIKSQGASQFNLIGNPYPSAIDADLFITENSSLIDGALYFWTHTTAIKKAGSFYVYNSDDYATYTLTGGIGTGIAHSALSTEGLGMIPTGKIAAGEAFFVASKTDGNFVFNNGMRVLEPNNQFFKMPKTKNTTNSNKNRVWLNLTNEGGIFKQLLVGYIAGATNDIDDLYDGVSFDGNPYADFYSVNNGMNLVIQGRALPFLPTDKVPLGFKTTVDGIFEIKIDHVDGLLNKYNIYLEDKNSGVLHDLKKSSYSFLTLKGEYNNRFVLSYLPNLNTNSVPEIVESKKQQLEIYIQENRLSLKSKGGSISAVNVYDLKGNMLYQKEYIDKEQFVLSDLIPKHQILIVKTVFSNTVSRTDKIFF
jgi:hypothetical protein